MNEWTHPDVPDGAQHTDTTENRVVSDLAFPGADEVVQEWYDQIRDILWKCFGMSSDEATQTHKEFAARVAQVSLASFQLAALHFSPFQVASDLAASGDATIDIAEARKQYMQMFVDASERPNLEAQAYPRPDDPTLALNRN